MACPGNPCTPAPTTGSWTFTANPSANRFCDDRLIGLAGSDASVGTNLVSADPITGCLTRPEGPRGVWQHDPDGCQPDFAGPLNNPEFANLAGVDATKRHRLPLLQSACGETVSEIVSGDVLPGNLGLPAMLRDECCAGGTQWAVMAPEFLINGRQSNAGPCVSPRILGYVPYERTICPGRTVTEYRWFSLDKWQQAEVPDVIQADIFKPESGETQNIWFAAWRDETCAGGGTVKQLTKIGGAQLDRILDVAQTMLDEPVLIYQQFALENGATVAAGITYYPALPPATTTILNQTSTFNLNSIPAYKPGIHTGVFVRVQLVVTTFTQLFDTVFLVNGSEYARTTIVGNNGSDSDSSSSWIKIPSNGILNLAFYKQIAVAGNAAGVIARAYVVGFLK